MPNVGETQMLLRWSKFGNRNKFTAWGNKIMTHLLIKSGYMYLSKF